MGDVIAIGVGPATPQGFLGRVTGVSTHGSQTVALTQPASLLAAVPSGALDAKLDTSSPAFASAARSAIAQAAKSDFSCSGSAGANITATASFHTGLDLEGSWTLFGGLQSASLTADADADASLTGTVSVAGSCELAKTPIVSFDGPAATFFVGPVPVVISSEITIYLDATASAKAAVSTDVSASFSASTGIGWTKHGGFSPIVPVNPVTFKFDPPTLSASATVAADLTPTVDVLLYGVVGPELALKTGLALNADINKSPWWTLDAPVDLSAQLVIPQLGLSSPALDLYQHTFELAHATTPPPGPGPAVVVINPGDRTGTVGTALQLQIQASDTDGGALSYIATGLPAGLSISPTSGLITGTPTTAGSSTVTVSATDASGPSNSTTFHWTVSPASGGNVTFGSDLAGTPIGVDAGCGSNGLANGQSCTVVPGSYRPGNAYPAAAPVSGVITSITIKTTTADSFTVRLVRPGPGGLPAVTAVSTGPVLTTSGTGAPQTFAVHVPVQAGDLLAADGSRTRAVECDGGVDYTYSPPLTDGATGSPTTTIQGCHTLANATISPG